MVLADSKSSPAPPTTAPPSLLTDGLSISSRLKKQYLGGGIGGAKRMLAARGGVEGESAAVGGTTTRLVYGVFAELCRDTACLSDDTRRVLMVVQMLQVRWCREGVGEE